MLAVAIKAGKWMKEVCCKSSNKNKKINFCFKAELSVKNPKKIKKIVNKKKNENKKKKLTLLIPNNQKLFKKQILIILYVIL